MQDFEFEGKTVIIRVDLNSHYNPTTNKIEDSERIREHAKTIEELVKKNAKIVVLAHQGRKGDPDFIHLDQHAKIMEKYVHKKVHFVDDIVGDKAINSIKNLKPGDILLLDNVRFLDEETDEKSAEEHANGVLVRTLAPLADVFINDAFSVSHRSHASIVGFTKVLPSLAGRIMEREVEGINNILKSRISAVFVLGGAKPDDCLNIMEYLLNNKPMSIQIVLTCGVLGELFLIQKGIDLGKDTINFLKSKDYIKNIDRIKKLLITFKDKIQTPEDVAVDLNGRKELSLNQLPIKGIMMDIGKKTVEKYAQIIRNSKSIVSKGTPGVYENKKFEYGTKEILNAIAESDTYKLIGGGDTSIAIDKFKINRKKFSYISLAGGAFITALSGKKLPGVDALK